VSPGPYLPEDGLGCPSEKDWGNNSGSTLFLLLARAGLRCYGRETDILAEAEGFAKSSEGPDNRRTNFVEALLNELQHRPECRRVRELLKHAWRLVAVLWCASWSHRWRNNHSAMDPCLQSSQSLVPLGVFSDAEVDFFRLLRTQTSRKGGYVFEFIKDLPDVDPLAVDRWDGCPDRPGVGRVIGLGRDSSTVRQASARLEALWSRGVQHRGDEYRFCFDCNCV